MANPAPQPIIGQEHMPSWMTAAPPATSQKYGNLNEGDRNLRLAIDALSNQGVDTSNVDYTQIPEALRNYLRGGGQVQGKLSDLNTAAQQAQAQLNQQSQLGIMQQLFPGLYNQSPTSTSSDAISQAITPLLNHIHDQQQARAQQYSTMENSYLNNTRFPPGIKEILQQQLPFLQQAQQNIADTTEAAALQQPQFANLLSQLQATQKAVTKANTTGTAGVGAVTQNPDGTIAIK